MPERTPNEVLAHYSKAVAGYKTRGERVEEVRRELYLKYRHEQQLAVELQYLQRLREGLDKLNCNY